MFSPDEAHLYEISQKPLLAFDENKDFNQQREAIREKFFACLGRMPQKVDLNPKIAYKDENEKFTEYRIIFDVEKHVQAVCILCIPKLGKEKYPLAIVLQGHSKGMHVSMGRKKYDDEVPGEGDRDIALQALERGYAALCLEQRGMGERRTDKVWNKKDNGQPRCLATALDAILLGRSLIGERCWDISRAIDLALTFPEIDGDKILCTGNSGGGTATYYAACFDERIKVALPSCAVCTFKDSITAMPHCSCNYVPGIAQYMDMGDMATLIAPRKLVVISGKDDDCFPIKGALEAFETIKKVYTAAGVPNNCIQTIGPYGHRYYKENTWEAFEQIEKNF